MSNQDQADKEAAEHVPHSESLKVEIERLRAEVARLRAENKTLENDFRLTDGAYIAVMKTIEGEPIPKRLAQFQHNAVVIEARELHAEIAKLKNEIERLRAEVSRQTKAATHWFEEANAEHNRVEKLRADVEKLKQVATDWETTANSYVEKSNEWMDKAAKAYAEIDKLRDYKDLHEGRISKHGTDDCPYCNQEAEIKMLKAALTCDACDGSGIAISGPCGCAGRGLLGLVESLRLAHFKSMAKCEILNAEIASLKSKPGASMPHEHNRSCHSAGCFDAISNTLPADEKLQAALAEIAEAIKLISQYMTGEHRSLNDYIRNMLQAYVTTKGNYDDVQAELAKLRETGMSLWETLNLTKTSICTAPFPLRCPVCKHGNRRVGFDYCLLGHVLKQAEGGK